MNSEVYANIPVKVAVRCRPLSTTETTELCRTCVEFIKNEPRVVLGPDRFFTYDFAYSRTMGTVFPEASSSEDADNDELLCHSTNYRRSLSGNRTSDDDGKTFRKTECFVKASFLEIYNIDILDLNTLGRQRRSCGQPTRPFS